MNDFTPAASFDRSTKDQKNEESTPSFTILSLNVTTKYSCLVNIAVAASTI